MEIVGDGDGGGNGAGVSGIDIFQFSETTL
jgi:hypothetical protein